MTTASFPPLAPLVTDRGTWFRVVTRAATRIELQFYDDAAATHPSRSIELDAGTHLRGEVWEILVPDVTAGALYTWALEPGVPLLDPYSLAVMGPDRFGSDDPGRARPPALKSVVVAPDPPPRWNRPTTPWHESVVYELHVRGFTRHESSGVDAPGTYRGLAQRVDYLKDLGVTAVELLPVHEFDETEVRRGDGLYNFWGYSPIAWLAPNRRYSTGDPVEEFRAMVRALHDAGIQVFLDVVFNHTGELDATGPTWSLRGLDKERYYLDEDLTGCGNTVRAQHPTTRALILAALRWWVHGMGVDGFRFDLATVLARDEDGKVMEQPPLVRAIEADPWLDGVQFIAEAWDAAGGYQVGSWPGGPRWAVWNDRFRDGVRRAWLHDPGHAPELATRITGSSDVFAAGPHRSLNFVTSHDGFTLRDAVSYARRHNEANGEGGRDGHAHEPSANHGVEGDSDDADVRAARDRARRNLVATTLLAHGVPMLTAGDEFGRTQRGNNNAYCHDSELTWIDWGGLDTDAAFHRFVRGMIRLRRRTPALHRTEFLGADDATWFGPEGEPVDWHHAPGAFGYRLDGLCVLINLTDTSVVFHPQDGAWGLVADTSTGDIHDRPVAVDDVTVADRSLVVLGSA